MANIQPYTNQIRSARYGNEVRGSIVNALEAMNNDINDDTASAAAYAGQAASSAQAAATTAGGLSDILTDLSTLENTVEASEALRSTAESNRVAAENARVVAEQARENSESGYVAQAAAYAQQAAGYATSDYAMQAKSWAVGNAGGVRDDEGTNNAKYWSQQAEAAADAKGAEWEATLGTLAESWVSGGTNTRTGEDTNNAEYFSEESKKWAVGTTDSSTSGTDTNNAKYWAGQAQATVDAAGEEWETRLGTLAESWVNGGTQTRSGEDTNNAQYWSGQAQYWADQASAVVTEGGVSSFNDRRGDVSPEAGDYDSSMIVHGTGSVASSLSSLSTAVDAKMDGTTSATTVAIESSLTDTLGGLLLRKVGKIVIASGSISSSGNLPMGSSSNPESGQLFEAIPATYRPKANTAMRGLLIGTGTAAPYATGVTVTTSGIVYQNTSGARNALFFSGTWETN